MRDLLGQSFFVENIDPILFFISIQIDSLIISNYLKNGFDINSFERDISQYKLTAGIFLIFLSFSIISFLKKRRLMHWSPIPILLIIWGAFSIVGSKYPNSLVLCLPGAQDSQYESFSSSFSISEKTLENIRRNAANNKQILENTRRMEREIEESVRLPDYAKKELEEVLKKQQSVAP